MQGKFDASSLFNKRTGVGCMALLLAGIILISQNGINKSSVEKASRKLTEIDYSQSSDIPETINAKYPKYDMTTVMDDFLRNPKIKEALVLSDKIQNGEDVEENGKRLVAISDDVEQALLKGIKDKISTATGIASDDMLIVCERDADGLSVSVVSKDNTKMDWSIDADSHIKGAIAMIVQMQSFKRNDQYVKCSTKKGWKKFAGTIEEGIMRVGALTNAGMSVKENTKGETARLKVRVRR